MTSPVDTSVKFFTSSMPGAPVLNGVAGSLISLLDACLVDGFGSKSATSLVVAGGIATLTISGGESAALTDSVILVSGATPAALNGEQKVLSASATAVTFATDEADVTATGTISFKLAPAGWAKPFAGTNLAAYKSVDPEGTGCLLRVDDTGTTSARVVGYESMSAISAGIGPFPTEAQRAGGGYWSKSTAANATGNNWTLVADGRFLMLFVAQNSGAIPAYIQGSTRCFGDPIALRPSGDAYACVLSYSTQSSTTSQFDGGLDTGVPLQHAMPRSYTGLGSCVLHCTVPYTGNGNAFSGGDSTMGAFPSVVDGGLRLSKKYLATSGTTAPPRADVPGYYWVPQTLTFDTIKWGDRVPGTGPLAGRTLFGVLGTNAALTAPSTSNSGLGLIDITGPWR